MKMRWTLIAALALMTSCGKEIPEDIIQPEKMETVLYDYHLAMGMSNNLKNPEKEAYKKYVFKKHQITEAVFDSSMVWYTREAQELTAIYNNLEKRFKREHTHAEMLLGDREEESTRITMPGDTVDIWNKAKLIWLSKAPLSNQVTFDFKADSNFHAKDAFLWKMDFHFLSKGVATMGFNIVYDNDSVIGETRRIAQSGNQAIRLATDSVYKIKALNGFIHVEGDSLQNPNILVNNISLTRYHRLPEDSLNMVAPYIPQGMMDEAEAPEEELVQTVEAESEKEETVKPQSAEDKKKPRKERLLKSEKRER